MPLIPNKGSTTALRTGAIYRLVEDVDGRWRLENRLGQRFTARGSFNFVRIGDRFFVSKRGEHVHISKAVDILYAGEVRFGYNRSTRGRIRGWSNASGHYQPPAALAHQAGFPLDLFDPIDAF